MALTIAQFAIAIRASTAAPTGAVLTEVTRLKAYADGEALRVAPAAPEIVRDEAAVALGGYLWDGPGTLEQAIAAGRASNALRNSGMLGILGPYRTHRAGVISMETAAMAEAGARAGDNLTNVTIASRTMTFTFASGRTIEIELPAAPAGQPSPGAGSGTPADGSVDFDQLATDLRDTVETAVQTDGISISDFDIVFTSDGGDSKSITVPGLAVQDEGTGLHSNARTLNFTGAGVTASARGSTVTVAVPGATSRPSSGGGMGDAAFEAALQYDTARVTDARHVWSDSGYVERTGALLGQLLVGDIGPSIEVGLDHNPAAGATPEVGTSEDEEWTVTVKEGATLQAAVALGTWTFKLSALAAIPRMTQARDSLIDANTISTTLGGVKVRIGWVWNAVGKRAGDFQAPEAIIGIEKVSTFYISVTERKVDLEGWARKSRPTDLIPASRLAEPPGLTAGNVAVSVASFDGVLADTQQPKNTVQKALQAVDDLAIDSILGFQAPLEYVRTLVQSFVVRSPTPNTHVPLKSKATGGSDIEFDTEEVSDYVGLNARFEIAVTGYGAHNVTAANLARAATATTKTFLDDTNSYSFSLTNDSTLDTTKFRIGRWQRVGKDVLVMSADDGLSYTVTIKVTELNIERFAQRSEMDRIPGSKLPMPIPAANLPKRAAGDVTIDASGFDGNLARTDTDAQKLAQAVDDLALGLGQAAVDARIVAGVPAWAREPASRRFTDEQAEVFGAFKGGDVWAYEAAVQVQTATFNAVPTQVQLTAGAYAASYQAGSPAKTNQYFGIRVTKGDEIDADIAAGRVRLANFEPGDPNIRPEIILLSTAWTKHAGASASSSTYDYYYVQMAAVGASVSYRCEVFTPFELDGGKVGNFFVPQSWARDGNADRIPLGKLPEGTGYSGLTFAETFPGLTLTRTDADRRQGALTSLATSRGENINLAGSGAHTYSHGEFHCSLHLKIAPVSDVNMGFVRNKSNQTAEDRELVLSNIVFASDLAEESAFVAASSGNLNGIDVFRVPVYSANTLVGTYVFLLGHTGASKTVGSYRHWDGAAGATGATLTAEFRMTFTPSDSAGGGGAAAKETYLDWTTFASASGLRRFSTVHRAAIEKARAALASGKDVWLDLRSSTNNPQWPSIRLPASDQYSNAIYTETVLSRDTSVYRIYFLNHKSVASISGITVTRFVGTSQSPAAANPPVTLRLREA